MERCGVRRLSPCQVRVRLTHESEGEEMSLCLLGDMVAGMGRIVRRERGNRNDKIAENNDREKMRFALIVLDTEILQKQTGTAYDYSS